MRGRKPVPTALHDMRGTTRTTRHVRDRAGEPIAAGSLADPPEWLTERQKEGWRYAIAHAPKGLLKPIDRAVLAIWVEAEDRHRTAAMTQAELDRGAQLPLARPRRYTADAALERYRSEVNANAGMRQG